MTGKKIRKMTIPPKTKMEHTYCVSLKKNTLVIAIWVQKQSKIN